VSVALHDRPRIRVIRNPSAGIAAALSSVNRSEEGVRDLLDRHAVAAEIETPEDEDAARTAVRRAIDDGVDVVVAAGGDGTVHMVVDELLGSDVALGILPLGRVMNVARALGIPRDLEAAADVIAAGTVRAVDVGEAMASDDRTVTFLETGSVGLNAAIFREVSRGDEGQVGSIVRTIWTAIRYRPARLRIELDDGVVETRALMVTASIGPYVGLGMTVAPSARLDDGRFDVSVFRRFSKVELLRHLASIAFGRRQYAPQVMTYRSARARIGSVHPLPARADMYDLGWTPVEFRTRARALRVVAPTATDQSVGAGSSASASGRLRL
jgi:YegS/Rv2252/BmrU family lipid kinase